MWCLCSFKHLPFLLQVTTVNVDRSATLGGCAEKQEKIQSSGSLLVEGRLLCSARIGFKGAVSMQSRGGAGPGSMEEVLFQSLMVLEKKLLFL